VLDRLEPAVRDLVTHVEERSDHDAPDVTDVGPEIVAERETGGGEGAEAEAEGHG
jgi:hypothetical protein